MFAILRTACGCEKIVQVREFTPVIRLAMMVPMSPTVGMGSVADLDPSADVMTREFRFVQRVGSESAEYRELVQRPATSSMRSKPWTPRVPHPLVEQDRAARRDWGGA